MAALPPLPVNPMNVPGMPNMMQPADIQQVRDENVDVNAGQRISIDQAGELVAARFEEFLEYFVGHDERREAPSPGQEEEEESYGYKYRDQLTKMVNRDGCTLYVDFSHIAEFDYELKEALEMEFYRFEPYLRRGLFEYVSKFEPEYAQGAEKDHTQLFVSVYNLPSVLAVRSLRTDKIGHVCSITGTVTRSSDVRPELLTACFRCGKCGNVERDVEQQFQYTQPLMCTNPRCDNRTEWQLETADSTFVDWQRLRVQENSDEIPAGSMPRSVDVIVRGEVVEKAKAGDKCIFTGFMAVVPDSGGLSRAGEAAQTSRGALNNAEGVRGLKALGVRELTYKTCFVASSVLPAESRSGLGSMRPEDYSGESQASKAHEVAMEFSPEEREEIRAMKSTSDLYNKLVNSVAPSVFGHQEVKRGVLLMLLGGVHKTTQEGIKLRGDINVCIVGDPSVAKSQFLKYVHAFLPRAVYTSGKASSAAGLTASVMRDNETGEYVVEAGALMLADNGICCIDEFDKMDPGDQVAIHEAMEQQTISITKAGIQATLNARASILAAANPVYGRYDRGKTLKANVNLSAPILSRFDLFFVVLDEMDDLNDFRIANHIIDVHCRRETQVQPPFSTAQLQRYIRFARSLNPTITPESQERLVECYRMLRQGDSLGSNRTAYRITVRQLESMVRLSEALARLHCDDEVKPVYVSEAFRLLKQSIIHVDTEDVTFEEEEMMAVDGDRTGEYESAEATSGEHDSEGAAPNTSDSDDKENSTVQNLPAEGVAAPSDAPASTAPTTPAPKKRKAPKTKISFEMYQQISNAIATMVRRKEDANETVTWNQCVTWYLEENEYEMNGDMEELARLKKLAHSVIKKLIKHDSILVFLSEKEEGLTHEDRVIGVHPNYNIGGQ